jgi:hypothetical protein
MFAREWRRTGAPFVPLEIWLDELADLDVDITEAAEENPTNATAAPLPTS